ncbi:MAG: hypothetical protein Aurels2KO_58550 [Aureliella sp.]
MEALTSFIREHPIPVLIGFVASVITIGGAIGRIFGYIPPLKFPRRTKTQPRMQCRLCNGTGKDHVGGVIIPGVCDVCAGKGYVITDRVGQPNCPHCPHCRGSGRDTVGNIHIGGACEVCGGIGVLPRD